MMNYYRMKEEIFFNEERIGVQYWHTMRAEEPQNEVELYCGAELLESIRSTGHLPEELRGLVSWETRLFHRNKYILRAWGVGFNGISRELEKTDKVIYKITYEKQTPSIKTILDYSDGDKAIQWLKDRGMTTCPLNPQ